MSRPPVRFTFNMPSFMLSRQTSANKALILESPMAASRQFSGVLNSPNVRIPINQTNQSNQSTLSQRTPRARSANQSPQVSTANTPRNMPLMNMNAPAMLTTSSASMMSLSNAPNTPHSTRSENATDNSFIGRVMTSHREVAALIGIYSRPWIQSRYTLLVLTFMLVVFNIISLYFTIFGLYLTHYLHTTTTFPSPTPTNPENVTEMQNECGTRELTGFLLFVMVRSVIDTILLAWRVVDRTLWVNHWPSLKTYQKVFLTIRSSLCLCTVAALALSIRWTVQVSSVMSDSYVPGQLDCVQLAYEVIVGLTAFEIACLVAPVLFLIPMSCFFNWKTLSYFAPFLPLTPDMFEKPIAGLSAEEIKKLPSSLYDPSVHTSDKCSICLSEFAPQESIRVLPCQHVFNTECIDEWLSTRRTCPLCVQVVEPVSSKRKFSFALSRTRRNESVTRSRNSASHSEHSDDENPTDEHDFGLRHTLADGPVVDDAPVVAIEMVDQSTAHHQ